jgi:beta-glucosidase
LIDPLSAIAQWVNQECPDTIVQYSLTDFNLAQAEKIARQAALTMVFVNADSGEQYITVGPWLPSFLYSSTNTNIDDNMGDRNNLTLWHGGDALIQAAASQCNNTIVVIHSVGAVIVEDWIDNPNVTAVLFAGLPGQESGNAILDVLNGKVNPSGRLPFSSYCFPLLLAFGTYDG